VQAKITIANSRETDRLVFVEPWGELYTLHPKKSMDLVAFGETEAPWFTLVETDEATQIYIEKCVDFVACQPGERISCGHSRRH
jgi:hypothetical protein